MTVLCALGLLAAACGGGAAGGGATPAQGGTFTFALPADPGALDPATAVLSVTNTVLSLSYDTLVSTGEKGRSSPRSPRSGTSDRTR
ncbi:hypothetical protein [Thermocatellispora tengchongensis]|uniref:hypothetical protein n=1 Tax=Thermocatellispora tengchongensis TaxID=1073253 RepID=UPI003645F31B